MQVKNYLLGYQDLYIVQDTQMFNFSLDSVLLPNFVTILPTCKKILDIGCGNAPIPLILSRKTKAKITGVEIQEDVFHLACESVKLNQLENQIEILNGDIRELSKTIESDTYDVITCNPPYFKVTDQSKFNATDYKTIARHEVMLNLEDIFQISRKLLKNGGVVALVHRPERLIDLIVAMRAANIEPKRIQFVYPGKEKEANILLIEGKKNGRPGIQILPPIYSHENDGSYTEQIKAYFS